MKGKLKKIREMLTYKRHHESATEMAFIRRYIDVVPGMLHDEFGNRFIDIGRGKSRVMWSAHTDTVHPSGGEGFQKVCVNDDGHLALAKGEYARCLGADDGAGVFILLELIYQQKPGLYVFHRGEEKGRLGSKFIAENYPGLLANIDYCIAFDRKSYGSVITHQRGRRTCSQGFVNDLARMMDGELYLEADDGGSYTDSATYDEIIPECTNISVGYDRQHTSSETLDTDYLFAVCSAFITNFDETKLSVHQEAGTGKREQEEQRAEAEREREQKRKEAAERYKKKGKGKKAVKVMVPTEYHGPGEQAHMGFSCDDPDDAEERAQMIDDAASSIIRAAYGASDFTRWVEENAWTVAFFLEENGLDKEDIREYILACGS